MSSSALKKANPVSADPNGGNAPKPETPLKKSPFLRPEMSDEDVLLFIDLIYSNTGIQMNLGKKALLSNRLGKILDELQATSYQDLHERLKRLPKTDPTFVHFIDVVTTNETYFFRAPQIWKYYTETFLPGWMTKANLGSGPLKVWCGASSSGEEPYTIAILSEEFAHTHPGFAWTLTCSDISRDMLEKCAKGTYSGRSIEKVDPKHLAKYFESANGKDYTVAASLRRKVSFFPHNLLEEPRNKGFDIIFLRNVMIYFDTPVKEKVLKFMSQALKPKGILVIGEAEALVGVNSPFTYLSPSIYQNGG